MLGQLNFPLSCLHCRNINWSVIGPNKWAFQRKKACLFSSSPLCSLLLKKWTSQLYLEQNFFRCVNDNLRGNIRTYIRADLKPRKQYHKPHCVIQVAKKKNHISVKSFVKGGLSCIPIIFIVGVFPSMNSEYNISFSRRNRRNVIREKSLKK